MPMAMPAIAAGGRPLDRVGLADGVGAVEVWEVEVLDKVASDVVLILEVVSIY
jgi:hypothetical protein